MHYLLKAWALLISTVNFQSFLPALREIQFLVINILTEFFEFANNVEGGTKSSGLTIFFFISLQFILL